MVWKAQDVSYKICPQPVLYCKFDSVCCYQMNQVKSLKVTLESRTQVVTKSQIYNNFGHDLKLNNLIGLKVEPDKSCS